MKSDFLVAITQLSAEKNLPKEVVFKAVEAALVSAYKKDQSRADQDILVKIHPATGEVKVYVRKLVVEEITDPNNQISLSQAKKLKSDAQVDDIIDLEITPANAGRIAAQTAKQVVLQRLREAERDIVFEEYVDKEGQTIMGVIQRVEPRQIIVELGKSEAVLPTVEQVRTERYRMGQRLKLYVLEVRRSSKGPQVIVSRSHSELLRCLFELEVPEIHNGTVELKAIAREAGYRSKVAVAANQEGLDPVGSCVGLRGIRIQNIVNELNGERIDIVKWHPDPQVCIANALSPAQVNSVKINEEEMVSVLNTSDVPFVDFTVRRELDDSREYLSLYIELMEPISEDEILDRVNKELLQRDKDWRDLSDFMNYTPLKVSILPKDTFKKYLHNKEGMARIERIGMREERFKQLLTFAQ